MAGQEEPKKLLDRSIVWFALGVGATAIVGFIGVQSYLREMIDDRIQDPRVNIALGKAGGVNEARVKEMLDALPQNDALPAKQIDDRIKETTANLTTEEQVKEMIAQIPKPAVPSWLEIDERFTNRLETVEVPEPLPRGAVLAFERDDLTADTCPDGWQPYKNARGRVIIGAGDPSESEGKFGFDETGNLLTQYVMRQHGGAETHTLIVAEMPSHRHSYVDRHVVAQEDDEIMTDGPSRGWGDHPRNTETAGGGKPHNNMPPYIALYFCKKES